jgi:hypothetical protein
MRYAELEEAEKAEREEEKRRLQKQSDSFFGIGRLKAYLTATEGTEEDEEEPKLTKTKEPTEEQPTEEPAKEPVVILDRFKKEKPKLLKRQRPLPTVEQFNPICEELIAKFKAELLQAQKDALEKEKDREGSLLNEAEEGLWENEPELVQDIIKTVRFKAKREVVKRYDKGVIEFHNWLKKNYNVALTSKTLWEPPKWLRQKPFWNRLEKGSFQDVYGYLVEHIRPWSDKEAKALIQRAGGRYWKEDHPANDKEVQDVTFAIDYYEMSKEFGLSTSALKKYLPAFVGAKIVKPLPKPLEHGRIIYSIGEYHRGYYDEKIGRWVHRPILYLKEKDEAVIEGLEKMKLPR